MPTPGPGEAFLADGRERYGASWSGSSATPRSIFPPGVRNAAAPRYSGRMALIDLIPGSRRGCRTLSRRRARFEEKLSRLMEEDLYSAGQSVAGYAPPRGWGYL